MLLLKGLTVSFALYPMKDGFLGPRQNHPRVMSYQYYKDCKISGDIDFIFGGASSVFENCHIHAVAPRLSGCPQQSSRPAWICVSALRNFRRASGFAASGTPMAQLCKSRLFHCDMQNAVAPIGFDPWAEQQQSFVFVEYPQTVSQRQHCVAIDQAQADRLQETAKQHCEIIFSKLNELKK